MPKGDRLVKCMRQAAKKTHNPSKNTDIVYGVVQNTSPLTVLVDNRLELTEEFLVLSPFCYRAGFEVTIKGHTHSASVDTISKQDHSHSVDSKTTSKAGGFTITPSASIENAGGHKVSVTLWDNLAKGDKLVMLRIKEGQEYLVLYRDKLEIKASCQVL